MLDDQISEAQQALNELFDERVLTFKLCAYRLDAIGGEEYIVRFNDNRLRAIDISWSPTQRFKDVFRSAIMERLGRMNGQIRAHQ